MPTIFKKHSLSIVLLLIVYNVAIVSASSSPIFDSAVSQFSRGAQNYDLVLLKKSSALIQKLSIEEQQKPDVLLLLGLIYWRQELIAYCSNTSAEITRNGKIALEKLDAAEKAGADLYLTASHKALACQLLASQNMKNGALYGPRTAKELKKAQDVNPKGYFSLFIEAVNINQMPTFVGGSPKKAAVLLEKLSAMFPDSIDVKIHLAEAYGKTGRSVEAYKLITPIIKTYPLNLLARKIAAKLPRRLSNE